MNKSDIINAYSQLGIKDVTVYAMKGWDSNINPLTTIGPEQGVYNLTILEEQPFRHLLSSLHLTESYDNEMRNINCNIIITHQVDFCRFVGVYTYGQIPTKVHQFITDAGVSEINKLSKLQQGRIATFYLTLRNNPLFALVDKIIDYDGNTYDEVMAKIYDTYRVLDVEFESLFASPYAVDRSEADNQERLGGGADNFRQAAAEERLGGGTNAFRNPLGEERLGGNTNAFRNPLGEERLGGGAFRNPQDEERLGGNTNAFRNPQDEERLGGGAGAFRNPLGEEKLGGGIAQHNPSNEEKFDDMHNPYTSVKEEKTEPTLQANQMEDFSVNNNNMTRTEGLSSFGGNGLNKLEKAADSFGGKMPTGDDLQLFRSNLKKSILDRLDPIIDEVIENEVSKFKLQIEDNILSIIKNQLVS